MSLSASESHGVNDFLLCQDEKRRCTLQKISGSSHLLQSRPRKIIFFLHKVEKFPSCSTLDPHSVQEKHDLKTDLNDLFR